MKVALMYWQEIMNSGQYVDSHVHDFYNVSAASVPEPGEFVRIQINGIEIAKGYVRERIYCYFDGLHIGGPQTEIQIFLTQNRLR
jgi:hypothetical protein